MAAMDKRGVLATLGVGVVLVLCCAAPALIAAGVLGALSAWLRNPWVIGAAIAAVLVLVWQVRTRDRRGDTTGSHSDRCHPSGDDRPSSP